MGPASLTRDIDLLVSYAVRNGLIECEDAIWARNTVLGLVGGAKLAPTALNAPLSDPAPDASHVPDAPDDDLAHVLSRLHEAASSNGSLFGTLESEETFATHLMGALTPRPSQVTRRFYDLYESVGSRAEGARIATAWFHDMCRANGYIGQRPGHTSTDISWLAPSVWGYLRVTINLAKPEKDPRAIAAAAQAQAQREASGEAAYPACQLCLENEGYFGRLPSDSLGPHPARQNLRVIPITLGDEPWGFQFSPYAYYDQHCIVMNAKHVPMHVDRGNMSRMFDFVDLFPHYFVGSNADLPIVGGSILTHDHFQGGGATFPLDDAPTTQVVSFQNPAYTAVGAHVLHWPLTAIRLESSDRELVLDVAEHILSVWRDYDDPAVGIVSHDADGTPHNTVTPIARRIQTNGTTTYRMYLLLRCNVTSQEHPLGVFHPHAELHHIKRENIGLIEAMGMAILPARLQRELTDVADALVGNKDLTEIDTCKKHANWALDVAKRRLGENGRDRLDQTEVMAILREEVGVVFARVLEDCGVFAWDERGRCALNRFLDKL